MNILKIATEFREGLLEGRTSDSMCWVICHPLAGYLAYLGVDCGSVIDGRVMQEGNWCGHCWIDMRNGQILDPTADQFSTPEGQPAMPPVYLGKKPDWYDHQPIHP